MTTKPLTETEIIELLQDMADLRQEHFVCLSLDINGQLIAKRTVFIGTLTALIAHPREIFADPITDRAGSIVIVRLRKSISRSGRCLSAHPHSQAVPRGQG